MDDRRDSILQNYSKMNDDLHADLSLCEPTDSLMVISGRESKTQGIIKRVKQPLQDVKTIVPQY